MRESLGVFFEGDKLVGRLSVDEAQHLTFEYDPGWLTRPERFPLSLAIPCRAGVFLHPIPHVFFDNLLPEDQIRRALEQGFKLPKESPYLILKMFGDDLAGALSVRAFTDDPSSPVRLDEIYEVSRAYVDHAIDDGRKLYEAVAKDFGARFSLAGAQDKFVVIYERDANKIYVSSGVRPTTHILKIDLAFRNSQTVYNEFFCLRLASAIGLPTVRAVIRDGLHPHLLIERYDRVSSSDGRVARLHQEDLCQAQGLSKSLKYEQKGGKPFSSYFSTVREHSSRPLQDLDALLRWLSFNLIVGNNDCHGKNLAFLYSGPKVALAPLYDLFSTEVYGKRFDQNFAFSVGGTFSYQRLRPEHLIKEAGALGIDKAKLHSTFQNVARLVEGNLEKVEQELLAAAPKATIGGRIVATIRGRLTHFQNVARIL